MDRSSWGDLARRPLLFPAAMLAAGAYLSAETGQNPAKFLVPALILGTWSVVGQHRTGAHLCLLLGCLLTGLSLGTWQARTVVPFDPLDRKVTVEGEVEEVLAFSDGLRLRLAVGRMDSQPARFRALLYADAGGPRLHPGQRVLVETSLRPGTPAANPGQYDLHRPRLRRGVRYQGGFKPERLVVLSPPSGWRLWLERTHRGLEVRTRELAPSPEAAALFLTLAAGLRTELSAEAEETFARSGLAHVLSVSGLHVAALALLLVWLTRRLAVLLFRRVRSFDLRRPSAVASIPLVWAYVAFTGWQPPAVRSAVMASAFLVAMAGQRRADALNSLAVAALAVGMVDPAAVGDLSMQLSFVAVLSLVLLAPAIRAVIPVDPPQPSATQRGRYWLQRVRETVLITLAASVAVSLATLPLTASSFHRVSLAGLVANVVALPLCSVLTGLAASAAAVASLDLTLASPLLWLGTYASELLLRVGQLFARAPLAALPLPSFGAAAAALFFLGLGTFALARGRWRWISLGTPLGLALALSPLLPRTGLEVTFLAVGHGDAIVVSSRGRHALIDGGGSPRGADTGQRFVLPFLRDRGINALELAVLSHPHADHALGLASTLAELPTRRVWLPAGAEEDTLAFRVATANALAQVEWVEGGHPPLTLGEATIRVLGPPADRSLLEGTNDRSVVLEIHHRDQVFLLTGDIEAAAEEQLRPGPVTVLKAAHHGSRTSSTEAFLAAARPRYVVFCVAAHSRFGFPHPEVVQRAQALGARCLRTDQLGAITFRSDEDGLSLTSYRAGDLDGEGPLPLPEEDGLRIVSGP